MTNDASAPVNRTVQERLRLISLSHTGLLADLRKLNTGRPTTFDCFFEKLAEVVEMCTAAEDRRHNVSHLAHWISLENLRRAAADRCPADTPIPSKSLMRFQFFPRNPYAKTALNFTSKIPIQYKV